MAVLQYLFKTLAAVALLLCSISDSSAQTFTGSDIGVSGDGVGAHGSRLLYNRFGYSHFSEGTNTLRYTTFDGGSWITQSVDSTVQQAGRTALIIAGTSPRIVFTDQGRGHLRYAHHNGSNWAVESIDSSGRVGEEVSAAICGPHLCISYYDRISGDLRFAIGSTGSWQSSVIDPSANDVGSMSSLAVLNSGRPIIAYTDRTTRVVKVAEQLQTGSWSIETVTYPGESIGGFPSIVVASTGTLHLTTSHLKSSTLLFDSGLFYATKPTGGSWAIAQVGDLSNGGPTALSVRVDGTPEFAARFSRPGVGTGVRLFELLPSGLFGMREFSGSSGSAGRSDGYDRIQLTRDHWGDPVVSYRYSSLSPLIKSVRIHRAADLDLDGIPDHREALYSTSGSNRDTDGDGMSDGDEVLIYGTNPLVPNSSVPPPMATPTPTPVPPVTPTPAPTPTPTPDPRAEDPDRDGDGLSNEQELALGTNPDRADSDADGVSDGTEVSDQTNPLDPGSALYADRSMLCLPLSKRIQILSSSVEVENFDEQSVEAQVVGRSNTGAFLGTKSCSLGARSRCSVELSAIVGSKNRTGSVCVLHTGVNVESRLVSAGQTKTSIRNTGKTETLLRLAVPGTQFLPVQRRDDSRDGGVILLHNPQATPLRSELTLKGSSGRSSRRSRVLLPPYGTKEIVVSGLRSGEYGQMVIQPAGETGAVVALGIQDGRTVGSKKGTGEVILLPVNRGGSIELTNTAARGVSVSVVIRTNAGGVLRRRTVAVPAGGSIQLASRELGVTGARRVAEIDSDLPGSIIANYVSIGEFTSGEVPLGSAIRGGVDLAPGHVSELLLVNGSSERLILTLRTGVGAGVVSEIDLPGNGHRIVRLPRGFSGLVEATAGERNALSGWILGRSSTTRTVSPLRP